MEAKLLLREATMDDAEALFAWRNDWETRRYFKNPEEVSWEDHLDWLKKTVAGETSGRTLRIVTTKSGERVGVVRADERDDGFSELSYTVAPSFRGKGMGKQMVVQFVKDILPGKKLMATVEDGHVPSEKIAAALGLRKTETEQIGERTFVIWK